MGIGEEQTCKEVSSTLQQTSFLFKTPDNALNIRISSIIYVVKLQIVKELILFHFY